MKVLLCNDTWDFHGGSKACMGALNDLLEDHEVTRLDRNRPFRKESKFADHDTELIGLVEASDVVIVNGEGTMHHDTTAARYWLYALLLSQRRGKKTALVNAVWDTMNVIPDRLRRLDLLTTRDPFSQQQLWAMGVDCHLFADLCLLERRLRGPVTPERNVPRLPTYAWGRLWAKNEWVRDFLKDSKFNDSNRFDVPASMSHPRPFAWGAARLQSSEPECYLTGQHHGIYMAGLAGARFMTFPGNCHKIEALIHWSGLPIPSVQSFADINTAMKVVEHADRADVYGEFFKFIQTQTDQLENKFVPLFKELLA